MSSPVFHLPVVPEDLLRAYLRHIDAEAVPPSVAALTELHRVHQMALSHESTWIHLGEEWDLDPLAAIARFTQSGRGGYCYHLNGSFAALLHTLGYAVTVHRGAVPGDEGPTAGLGNHMVLQVANLPNDANPNGRWHVDVGLGEGLLEPIPLMVGQYTQAPIHYELNRAPDDAPPELGDWRLRIEHPYCNVRNVWFDSSPVGFESFAPNHHELSHASTSLFVSMLLAHRRDTTGIDSLIGLVLARVETEKTQQTLEKRGDWFAALADVFGITLQDCDDTQREALWRKTLAAHETWRPA